MPEFYQRKTDFVCQDEMQRTKAFEQHSEGLSPSEGKPERFGHDAKRLHLSRVGIKANL